MCFCANVFTPCAVLNAGKGRGGGVGGAESAGFVLGQQTQRKEHPREDPWAILGSPLPGGEAIKPYPESRKKKKRDREKRVLQRLSMK